MFEVSTLRKPNEVGRAAPVNVKTEGIISL